MNELSSTIGTRTARPAPSRARTIRLRRRRGGGAPTASAWLAVWGKPMTVIGSAPYPDAFPALLHQVPRDASDLRAVGEDARVGVEPDVDGVARDRGAHRALQGARILGRVERDGERLVQCLGHGRRGGRGLAIDVHQALLAVEHV